MKIYLPLGLLRSLDTETQSKIFKSSYRKEYGRTNVFIDEVTQIPYSDNPFVIVPDDLYSKFSNHIDNIYKLLETVHNQESELKALREIRNNVEAMRKLFK